MIELNEEQSAAVNSDAPKRLVLAGAGSGKTRVLVAAVAREAGRSGAAGCCVVTFTNAAAQEMESRLKALGVSGLGYCGTLHSLMLRLCREHVALVGLPETLGVIDDAQREDVLETVRSEHGLKCSAKEALELLDACNGAAPVERVPTKEGLLVKSYYAALARAGMLDFASMLHYGKRVVERLAADGKWPYQFLGCDEFQDSSVQDQAIYDAMPCERRICCGDDFQAVYSFRGSNMERIVKLANGAPGNGWTMFLVENNYRCASNICSAANALIRHNADQAKKVTRAIRTGGSVSVRRCETPGEELAYVLERVMAHRTHEGRRTAPFFLPEDARDITILARTNRLAQSFAQHLAANGVPVRRQKRAVLPADWKRTKLLLTVLDDPWNDFAVLQLLRSAPGSDGGTVKRDAARAMVGLNEFLGFPYGKGGRLALDTDLCKHGVSPESRERVHDACRELSARGEWSVPELLLYLRAKEEAVEEEGDGVSCCTVHSAKGREWSVVFLVGMEEGLFPQTRKDSCVEEERRLAYVGITRAKDAVVMTWCVGRPQFRGVDSPVGPMQERQPSRFISESGLKRPLSQPLQRE